MPDSRKRVEHTEVANSGVCIKHTHTNTITLKESHGTSHNATTTYNNGVATVRLESAEPLRAAVPPHAPEPTSTPHARYKAIASPTQNKHLTEAPIATHADVNPSEPGAHNRWHLNRIALIGIAQWHPRNEREQETDMSVKQDMPYES